MKSVKQIASTLVLGVGALLALAPCGYGQTTATATSPPAVSAKTEFEQRSIKGWHARRTGRQLRQTQQAPLSEAPRWPTAKPAATPWTGTSTASMMLRGPAAKTQLVAEGPDVAYEDGVLMTAPMPGAQGASGPGVAVPQQVPTEGVYSGGQYIVEGGGGFGPGYMAEGPMAGPPVAGGYGGWGPGAFWGPSPFHFLRNVSLFAGVQGFKGPPDMGNNGNFGIHEGIDWGTPLGGPWGLGMQLGLQGVHSNFQGNQTQYTYENAGRDQIFFTAGLFRRNLFGGLQGGIAFDLMHDSYYYNADLKQVRLELSAVWPNWREIGFWGAFGVGDDQVQQDRQLVEGDGVSVIQNQSLAYTLQPMDQFNFFYRQYFRRGGDGRLWVGMTSQNDFIFGGDLWIPMGTHWAVENSFNFTVPNEAGAAGLREESWGVSIQLVWYPGYSARASRNNPFRPLLRTADNTVFMTHRQ